MLNYQRGLDNAIQQTELNNVNRLAERGLINSGALATGAQTQSGLTERQGIISGDNQAQTAATLQAALAQIRGTLAQEREITSRTTADRILNNSGALDRTNVEVEGRQGVADTQADATRYGHKSDFLTTNPTAISSAGVQEFLNGSPIAPNPGYELNRDVDIQQAQDAATLAVHGKTQRSLAEVDSYSQAATDAGIKAGSSLPLTEVANAKLSTNRLGRTPMDKLTTQRVLNIPDGKGGTIAQTVTLADSENDIYTDGNGRYYNGTSGEEVVIPGSNTPPPQAPPDSPFADRGTVNADQVNAIRDQRLREREAAEQQRLTPTTPVAAPVSNAAQVIPQNPLQSAVPPQEQATQAIEQIAPDTPEATNFVNMDELITPSQGLAPSNLPGPTLADTMPVSPPPQLPGPTTGNTLPVGQVGVTDFATPVGQGQGQERQPAPPEVIELINQKHAEPGDVAPTLLPEDDVSYEMLPNGKIRAYLTTPEGQIIPYDL